MKNALAFQRLESKGLYASTILREGMSFADDSIRVALVDPESDQAIQVVANQVLQRETQRDQQNTTSLVTSELPDLTAGQILQDMQYINREAIQGLAWVATHGNPREVEFARQTLGLAPQPEPHSDNDEEDSNRESFLERAKRSEIVLEAPQLARRHGWKGELWALRLFFASELVVDSASEERASAVVDRVAPESRFFVIENRPAPIASLRALAIVDPAPEPPRRRAKGVVEADTLENDE